VTPRRPARIVPVRDDNGATYWCVHPDDRAVRELSTARDDEPAKPTRKRRKL
jgi:hypothetical protein